MRDTSENMEVSECGEKNDDQQPPTKETTTVIICHRHKWSSEEEDAIKQLFATQINTKRVSMEEVRDLCKGHQLLGEIAASKIRDKVRTFFHLLDCTNSESSLLPQEEESAEEKLKRFGITIVTACKEKGSKDREEKPSQDKEDEKCSEDMEEEGSQCSSPSGVVPPSSRSRGGQDRLFSDSEMVEFRKLFAPVILSDKSITTKVAISMLKENNKLKHLAKKFTNQQIYDKLRTKRRIAKRGKNKTKI